MGLCKCPMRKVTNQFCYEHRMNVCDYCILQNHKTCVVQSYLHWLQDSDYTPWCMLCEKSLTKNECIRLVCYHLFHWDCLQKHLTQFPKTTAPTGYKCPNCGENILPKKNLVSPIADVLRDKLSSTEWGRIGLGFPPIKQENTKDIQTDENTLEKCVTKLKNDRSIENIALKVEENIRLRPENLAQVSRKTPYYPFKNKAFFVEEEENEYKTTYSGVNVWHKSNQKNSKIRKLKRMYAKFALFFLLIYIVFLFTLWEIL